jgi:hypothetical protein
VGVDAVGTDTDDDGIGLRNCIDSVAEPARFFSSARGVVFGIKPQDYVFAGVFAQGVLLAIAPRQVECRRSLSFQTCHYATSELNLCLSFYHTLKLSINHLHPILSIVNNYG